MKFVYLFHPWEMDRRTLDEVLSTNDTGVQYYAFGVFDNASTVEIINSNEKPIEWLKNNEFTQAIVCIYGKNEKVLVKELVDKDGDTLWTMCPEEFDSANKALSFMLTSMKAVHVITVLGMLRLETPIVVATKECIVYTGPIEYVRPNLFAWKSNS